MKWFWIFVAACTLASAACQPTVSDPQQLPTLAVLASAVPSETAAAPTQADTAAPPEVTATPMPPTSVLTTGAETALPTEVPSATPSETPTRIPVTIEIREEVRLATLTPVPQGVNAPVRQTPVVLADVVITEDDFQREMDRAIVGVDSIQFARVSFVPEGLDVELTALGGMAFVTGSVRVLIEVSGSFATITIDSVTVNAAEPSEAYLEVVNGDFFSLLLEVFDTLLTERVGENHDLENIVLNNEAMQIFLLVPAS